MQRSLGSSVFSAQTFFKQIRCHHWLKNVLIFLPALVGHKLNSNEVLSNATLAFFAFSICASFVYIVNDFIDIKSDRTHPTKKFRPLASGALSAGEGVAILAWLFVPFVIFIFLLPLSFIYWTLAYLTLNLLYSLFLKRIVVIDMIALSSMYILRLYAGGAATDIHVSGWLLCFSAMCFFSLVCVKRFTEITRTPAELLQVGRGYRKEHTRMVQTLGVAAAAMSVLILGIYVNREDAALLYHKVDYLWALVAVLLYWFMRIWILTARGDVDDDPVLFAIRDKLSWIALSLVLIIAWISA